MKREEDKDKKTRRSRKCAAMQVIGDFTFNGFSGETVLLNMTSAEKTDLKSVF